MSTALMLFVQLLSLLLRTVKSHDDCPDGICEAPLATAATVKSQLSNPKVSFGVFDLFTLLKCFPMDRVVKVVGRIGSLLNDCDRCPDGECSFFDILSCLDLAELVAIIEEIISIVQDSQMCDDGDGGEITLGEATA